MDNNVIRAEELAKKFNVSKKTVYDWVRNTSIPFLRIGRSVRFVEQDVLMWASKNARPISEQ